MNETHKAEPTHQSTTTNPAIEAGKCNNWRQCTLNRRGRKIPLSKKITTNTTKAATRQSSPQTKKPLTFSLIRCGRVTHVPSLFKLIWSQSSTKSSKDTSTNKQFPLMHGSVHVCPFSMCLEPWTHYSKPFFLLMCAQFPWEFFLVYIGKFTFFVSVLKEHREITDLNNGPSKYQ